MYMLFGWGDNPSKDEMKYRVLSWSYSVVSESGDTMISNCQPTHIALTVELPPGADPGKEFFEYSMDQHDTAADKGKGKIAVYKGKDVGESLLEMSFNNAWLDSLDISVSDADDKFVLQCMIAAAEVTIAGATFEHYRRAEHFSGS